MHNLKPKKYLGQHFLTDKGIAERIVKLLQADPDAVVAEIGPGKGVLTDFLIEKYPRLKLVEIDGDAVAYLQQHFGEKAPQIIHEDVLKWNLPADLPEGSFLIGNLPYNISSPIFFKILENRDRIQEGVFMIQKEVAKRICSPEGSKQYGILSVLLGHYYELKYAFSVGPGAFAPPPRVQSGVIHMKKREGPEEIGFGALKQVVKAGFNQRRKTLRNALKSLHFEDFEEKEKVMSMRAEQLNIAGFVNLAQKLKKS